MVLESRKAFWIVLLSLAVACVGAAAWLFPKALPLLQLQVSMSRDQAMAAAQGLQAERFPELATTRTVARFGHDGSLQNYIELEGGGVDAYTALLGQRYIAPYYWTVRRFSESQEDELSVRFTPEGHPYGFTRKLPEKAAGAALTQADARAVAQAGARGHLGDALWGAYAPLSASQVTRPGGRIDHSFIYEHQGKRRADARFRLKLVVAGDRLVELTPYAFVPQAFEQRFTQLRAGNETIAKVAGIGMFGVLGLGGLLGGWLWLTRRGGGLAWRSALVAGAVVGVFAAAAVLSNLPLAWFAYATTDSANSFLLRNAALALAALVGATLLLGLVFAVAEGLSRRAFPTHPRVFNFWSVASAASPQALGRTVGGYAWMAVELLLVAAFYLVARTQFGWWVPAESLNDPNILSAWRPAFEPIANALQAGTMEEALFRAVPLSAAALIGNHLGWRRSVIGFAVVLQALVFAGAHASYPGLPSYSRVVELFLPACVWGLIFLRYGLVPCMVMHFTFDLTLMSLPLFVASDSRLWLDRALVLAAGLVPLLMVARARLQQGHFAEMPASLRNGETMAPVPSAVADQRVAMQPPVSAAAFMGEGTARASWLQRTPLLIAGALGVLALTVWQTVPLHTPVFTLDHAGAITRGQDVLAARGVRLDADWKRLAIVLPIAEGDSKAVRFVWREAGPQTFTRLLEGGQISPQQWRVTFKHVAGPVEERSEDWEVALTSQGDVLAVFHHLPEGRVGAKLDREQALALVRAFMDGQPALAHRPWELASVQEIERPARRDWIFRWDDKQVLDVKGGSARVSINVRGDEIDAWQHVFVPEAWEREQLQKESEKAPFKIGMGVAGFALALLILGTALRQVVRGTLRWTMGLVWSMLLFVSLMAQFVLTFDHKAMAFKVAQPWDAQWTTGVAFAATGYLALAAVMGMLAMRLYRADRPSNSAVVSDLLRGLGLALLLKGIAVALEHFLPLTSPLLPGIGVWDSFQPLLSTVSSAVVRTCVAVAAVALAMDAVRFCSTRRACLLLWILCAAIALCSALAAENMAEAATRGLPMVLAALALWALVRRGEAGVAIAMWSWLGVADLRQSLGMAFVGAATHAALACAVTLALTWWALRHGRSLGLHVDLAPE